MPNVVIATTMWKQSHQGKGAGREAEYRSPFWNDMMAEGCSIKRLRTTQVRLGIIDSLAAKDRAEVLLPHEIVDTRLRLKRDPSWYRPQQRAGES